MQRITSSHLVKSLAAGLILGFGAYCYLTHLAGSLGGDSDENRVYHFQLYSPLLYFVSKPLISFFRSHDAPYYLQGALGLLNVGLTAWIVRKWCSARIAAWIAALLMVTYDFPLAFARMQYYSTLQHFLFLCAILCWTQALRTNAFWGFVLSGVIAGLMPAVNASGLIILGILFLFAVVAEMIVLNPANRMDSVRRLAGMGIGAILAYLAFELAVWAWFAAHPHLKYVSYTQYIAIYGRDTPLAYTLSWSQTKNKAVSFLFSGLSDSTGGAFRTSMLMIGIVSGIVLAWVRKEGIVKAVAISFVMSAALIFLGEVFRIQPFFQRTLLWTSLPVVVLVSYAFTVAFQNPNKLFCRIAWVLLIVYLSFGIQRCVAITHAQFSLNPIRSYLKEHSIHPEEIVTNFPVLSYQDMKTGRKTAPMPLRINSHPAAVKGGTSHKINWPVLRRMHREGYARYLLLPGSAGLLTHIGNQDPVLALAEPSATWKHPTSNRYLYTTGDADLRLRLYDLDIILSRPEVVALLDRIERLSR